MLLTVAAMLAFAANSLLCRMALGQQLIDAASFTSVRILAGALMLGVVTASRWRLDELAPDWKSVAALSGYMIFFSFAYRTLSAGTGALLLFGAVQLTMFAAAVRAGERFSALAWLGLTVALAGLIYLVAPGLTAPDPFGAALMVIAGVAWGAYSLIGRGAKSPLKATARNFFYSAPVAFLALLIALLGDDVDVTEAGLGLAAASGALASGLGYALWYAALSGLRAAHAATVQLSVPVIAALGGVMFLAEPFSARLAVASGLTLGGIALLLSRRVERKSSEGRSASRAGDRRLP